MNQSSKAKLCLLTATVALLACSLVLSQVPGEYWHNNMSKHYDKALVFTDISRLNDYFKYKQEKGVLFEIIPKKGLARRRRNRPALGIPHGQNLEIQEKVDKMIPQLRSATNIDFVSLRVVSYRMQLFRGVNYFVKARASTRTGSQSFVLLRIWSDTKDKKSELKSYKLNAELNDDPEDFL